jgi:hypothetical protein
VENTPFEVCVQINFTSERVEKLILRIFLMLTESKRECSRGIFHTGANRIGSKVNRSETNRFGKG